MSKLDLNIRVPKYLNFSVSEVQVAEKFNDCETNVSLLESCILAEISHTFSPSTQKLPVASQGSVQETPGKL